MVRKKEPCLYFFSPFLVFLSLKGFLTLNLKKQNLNSSFFFSCNYFFFIIFNKKNTKKQGLITFLKNSLKGINFFFVQKLVLIGIGFRCWTIFSKNNKFLVIKTSLSKDVLIYIPYEIDIFCLGNTTLMIRGLKKENIYLFTSKIKKIKKFNIYKQKGIFCENESIKLKTGKKV